MQEEVNQKTVALSIKTAKLTGKVLAAALGKVVRALQKHHRKALTPQGRQSVKGADPAGPPEREEADEPLRRQKRHAVCGCAEGF